MDNTTVRILISFTARPQRETELKHLLLNLVKNRCQEDGCTRCHLLQHHIYSQRFVVTEEWELESRLQSKLSPDYLEQMFQEAAALLEKPIAIDWYELIS